MKREYYPAPDLSTACTEFRDEPKIDYALDLNLSIISELNFQVSRDGARLVLVDLSPYFDQNAVGISSQLSQFSADHGIGYVPLYVSLLEANQKGVPTSWKCDRHFNFNGNGLFAEAMWQWLSSKGVATRSAENFER